MQNFTNEPYPQASMAGNTAPKPLYPVAQTQAYYTPTQRPSNPQPIRPQRPINNPISAPNFPGQQQTVISASQGPIRGTW
jgi:hypothetical protein